MKKIEELGISPWPWKNGRAIRKDRYVEATFSEKDEMVVDIRRVSVEDAILISAAPELFECLREAVVEKCEECFEVRDYMSEVGEDIAYCKNCNCKKWRDALAKAGGESEVLS